MPANPEALALDVQFEGFSARPYVCPAGVVTIGFGSTRYDNGAAVKMTDPPITKERAIELLNVEQLRCDVKIRTRFGNLGTNRLGALGSFAYNLGFSALSGSTLARKVKSGDHPGASAEFPRWVYGGGRRLLGLVRRRAAERAVYDRG